jgi:protein-S-isoprenylcysteine O-methyltransferase Ste14
MDIQRRLEKITSRTVVLYALTGLLVILANPSLKACFFGILIVAAGEALRLWATGHIKKNEELATSGPYAYIQSPMYLGSFIIATGLCIMARNSVIWVIAAAVYFLSYIPRKQDKEWARLEKIFGDKFLKYKSEVPYLILTRTLPYSDAGMNSLVFSQTIENNEHQVAIGVALLAIFIMIRIF